MFTRVLNCRMLYTPSTALHTCPWSAGTSHGGGRNTRSSAGSGVVSLPGLPWLNSSSTEGAAGAAVPPPPAPLTAPATTAHTAAGAGTNSVHSSVTLSTHPMLPPAPRQPLTYAQIAAKAAHPSPQKQLQQHTDTNTATSNSHAALSTEAEAATEPSPQAVPDHTVAGVAVSPAVSRSQFSVTQATQQSEGVLLGSPMTGGAGRAAAGQVCASLGPVLMVGKWVRGTLAIQELARDNLHCRVEPQLRDQQAHA